MSMRGDTEYELWSAKKILNLDPGGSHMVYI